MSLVGDEPTKRLATAPDTAVTARLTVGIATPLAGNVHTLGSGA